MNDAFPTHYHTTREQLNVFDNFWTAVFEDVKYREWIKARVISDCESGDISLMHWDEVEIKKNGKVIAYVNTANTPFKDQSMMISTVIDVTKKVQIKQDLLASEQLLYTTNKLAKVGGWELYPDYSMKLTKELYHMYEIPFDEKIHLLDHLKEFFPNNYNDVKKQFLITQETTSKLHFQLDFLTRKTKTHKWVEIIGVPVEENGKIVRVIGANRDITELHRMMTKQKQMTIQLQQSQKMEAIGTLAGGISHDFNNVLSGILGYTELALEKLNKPEKLESYLNEILSGTDRAIKLVKQILTFSRLSDDSNGKEVCLISDIVKEALDLLRSSIPSTIEIKANINTDALSFANSTQIHQIIMNLCTNAYQAMRETGGVLTVNLSEVDKTVTNNTIPKLDLCVGKYIQISVGDTGPGISDEVKEKMFDPYFTTKKTEQGTGLGLSVVQGITNSHKGCINVYSELGYGTIINVYLPMCDKNKNKIVPEDNIITIGTGTETIMVIDDEISIMKVVSEVLTSHGYIVFMFNDPLQAFEEFKKHTDRFDLIITDMTMPYMTGIELSRKILDVFPGFPIILCTGYSELTNKDQALELGIKEYLNKPLANQTLLKTVRHVLDIHAR
jgi:signal transduction histidine kinase/CheY-like chemotaxis protein